jgi:hypothetical protein
MLIQIPTGMPADYNTGLNLQLWILVIFTLFIMLPLGFLSASKSEMRNVKIVEKGRGFFGFFYAFGRLFFILGVLLNNGDDYDFWVNLGYTFSMIGFTLLIYIYEKYKLSKKAPFFTLIGAIASFFTLTGYEGLIPGIHTENREVIMAITSIASLVLSLMVGALYYQIADRFPGQLRDRTIHEFVGLIILLFGVVLDGQVFLTDPLNPVFFKNIYPVLMTLFGAWLLILSHDASPKIYKPFMYFVLITLFILFFMHMSDIRELAEAAVQ